ncbi:RDD family protein [Blastococcus sp. TML/M2B]|uniref:RDD family protein n=1 Tax=unclassified Blastococcus TaxID=2619396 RepID=UPI00190D6C6F|nr:MULTISPECIES: RDD family protein [unclassified Blastococcus]MBN1092697.1 RDD family protein [Blastococcus sp. TML/M2B]MBN1097193.1 RDD family protein [Blastococcus sp. TML/C7B]
MTRTGTRPPSPPASGEPEPGGPFPWRVAPAAPAPSGRLLASGRPAGFVTRAAANVVDVGLATGVVLLAYASVVGFRFLLAPTSFRLTAPAFAWVVVAVGAVLTVYWTASWTVAGRSHGDQLMGLRVAGPRGERLHLVHAAVRAVLCALFMPGLFWVLVSPRNRSAQDVVLHTSVRYR